MGDRHTSLDSASPTISDSAERGSKSLGQRFVYPSKQLFKIGECAL